MTGPIERRPWRRSAIRRRMSAYCRASRPSVLCETLVARWVRRRGIPNGTARAGVVATGRGVTAHHTGPPDYSSTVPFERPLAVAGVASVLLAVGLLTIVTSAEASFGWFAYTPLSEEVPAEVADLVVWTRQQAVGAALVVAALVLLSALGGYRAGRRAHDTGKRAQHCMLYRLRYDFRRRRHVRHC